MSSYRLDEHKFRCVHGNMNRLPANLAVHIDCSMPANPALSGLKKFWVTNCPADMINKAIYLDPDVHGTTISPDTVQGADRAASLFHPLPPP